MLFTDFLLIVALTVFLIVWWNGQWVRRELLLWMSAIVALVSGLASFGSFRFQAVVGCLCGGTISHQHGDSLFSRQELAL